MVVIVFYINLINFLNLNYHLISVHLYRKTKPLKVLITKNYLQLKYEIPNIRTNLSIHIQSFAMNFDFALKYVKR